VRQQSLAGDVADAAYIAAKQSWFTDRQMWVVARTNGREMSQAIRNAIWSVDNTQGVDRVGTMRDVVSASAATRRFALVIFQIFAAIALLLAATGLYGVLSAAVNARRQEIGVRSALGASTMRILGLVLSELAFLSIAGVALGIVSGAAISALLRSLFFGVSATDSVTYVGVVAVLALTAVVGCAVPALRAVTVEPTLALRAD
jgi:ABC-type antimicrobial peptide transport system permease subunit